MVSEQYQKNEYHSLLDVPLVPASSVGTSVGNTPFSLIRVGHVGIGCYRVYNLTGVSKAPLIFRLPVDRQLKSYVANFEAVQTIFHDPCGISGVQAISEPQSRTTRHDQVIAHALPPCTRRRNGIFYGCFTLHYTIECMLAYRNREIKLRELWRKDVDVVDKAMTRLYRL